MTTERPANDWVRIALTLGGAVLAGSLLAVVVTFVGRGVGGPETAPEVGGVRSADPAASGKNADQPTPAASAVASVSPSASPQPTPSPSPSESPVPSTGVTAGCFEIGPRDETSGMTLDDLVVAESLLDRLPNHDPPWSEPYAWYGYEGQGGYLYGFEQCTGADPTTMRFGGVQGSAIDGVIPMAMEVDGYSGWELADLMIDANIYDPDMRDKLEIGEHNGWTYLYADGFAVTASEHTLYLMQQFCCVDYMEPNPDIPSIQEIVAIYLDATIDEPAPMPSR